MKNPPHPGTSVWEDWMEPLGLSVGKGAEILGVSRQFLNKLVKGKAGISAEMAIRLEKAFGGGAETWLRMQAAFDLAQAEKHSGKIKVKRVPELAGTAQGYPPINQVQTAKRLGLSRQRLIKKI